jgi:diaminopimelate decarboxylase
MSNGFYYENGILTVDGVPLDAIAREHGTPTYVYSAETMRRNYRRVAGAFAGLDVLVAYSVKSNSNLGVLKVLREEGAGFDIVSGGELERVLRVGVPGERIIFAGVGKTEREITAAIEANVAEFNIESEPEAERINAVAGRMGRSAPVAIRINPNIDAKTHKYITTGKSENKFGISMDRARVLAARIVRELKNLRLIGLHCHIGSQILDSSIHPRVVATVVNYARTVMAETGVKLETLNFGGGFGIAYKEGEAPLDLAPFAAALAPELKALGVKLVLEPGRSIAGPAGALLSEVQYVKRGDTKTFVILDASMAELIRPTLYEAWHDILPVRQSDGAAREVVDFVGPVCETGDFLAQNRETAMLVQGDLVILKDAGAYGFVMASSYNSRPKPAEILVDGGKAHVVRRRETYGDLLGPEIL